MNKALAVLAFLLLVNFVSGVSLQVPDTVQVGSPMLAVASFDSASFDQAQVLLDSKLILTMYVYGSGRSAFDTTPGILAQAYDPNNQQLSMVLSNLSLGTHTLQVLAFQGTQQTANPQSTFIVSQVSQSDFQQKLVDDISKLKGQVHDLQSQNSEMSGQFGPLSATVQEIQQSSSQFFADYNILRKQLSELQVSSTQMAVAMHALQNRNDSQKTDLLKVQSDLGKLQEQVGQPTGGIVSGLISFVGQNSLFAVLFILVTIGLVVLIIFWNKFHPADFLYREENSSGLEGAMEENKKESAESDERRGRWAVPDGEAEEPPSPKRRMGMGDLIKKNERP